MSWSVCAGLVAGAEGRRGEAAARLSVAAAIRGSPRCVAVPRLACVAALSSVAVRRVCVEGMPCGLPGVERSGCRGNKCYVK